MFMLCFAGRCCAAAAAPVRAARNTGLWELFPIIAIVSFLPAAAVCAESAGLSLLEQPAAMQSATANASPVLNVSLSGCQLVLGTWYEVPGTKCSSASCSRHFMLLFVPARAPRSDVAL